MSTPPEPNIENSAKLALLFATPRDERDDAWIASFLDLLPAAGMRCADERVFNGPDGFLYFGLFLPKPGERFTPVSLESVLNFCCQEGLGVAVFNSDTTDPEWVFNYGSIWNFLLHKTFYENPFANALQQEEVQPDDSEGQNTSQEKASENVLVAQPSEALLPLFVRAVLLRDLEQQNIEDPSMLMMTVPGGTTYLVFNIYPEDFEKEHFEFVQQYIMWALPQGYSIATVPPDSEVSEHFLSLRDSVNTLN